MASRDGFESRAFHHRCDNQGPTVTLVSASKGLFLLFFTVSVATWHPHERDDRATCPWPLRWRQHARTHAHRSERHTYIGAYMQVRTSTGHIFGGFTAVSWRRGDLVTKPPRWVPSCVADPEAFVFRLYAPSNWTGVLSVCLPCRPVCRCRLGGWVGGGCRQV